MFEYILNNMNEGLSELFTNFYRKDKMSFFARIFGICKTKPPTDAESWNYSEGKIEVELKRISEISEPGRAVRLDGKGLSNSILLLHGDNGEFYAIMNKCTHKGRRLDPVAGTERIECCSLSKSTFDYTGKVISGPAKESLKMFPLELKGDKIIIWLN